MNSKLIARAVARLYRRRSEPEASSPEPPIVWEIWNHKGWGDSIYWADWERRELYGLTRPRPSVGDEMRARLGDGRVARFRVVAVDLNRDPPDYWDAKLSDIGYLEDDPDAPPATRFSVFGAALCPADGEPAWCSCRKIALSAADVEVVL